MITTSTSLCAIIEIPADFSTIQEGINASVSGDTILVSPGSYWEETGVHINNKGLVLASLFLLTGDTTYIYSTIISSSSWNGSRAVQVNSFDTVRIIGFTITDDQEGGIYCYGNTEILNNRVINIHPDPFFTSQTGIGIYAFGNCLISDNEISGNTMTVLNGSDNYYVKGAGIFASGDMIIRRNHIHNNGCNIEGQNATLLGGGIYCEGSCLIANNIITDNYMQANSAFGLEFDTRGAGIYLLDSGIVLNNLIHGNHATADAIALSLYPNAESYGGGVFCNSGALIQNNTIASNSCWASAGTDDGVASAGAAGGGVYGGTLINNLIIGNSCGANAFGMEWYSCGTCGGGVITSGQVINNTIVNNSDGGCDPHGGGVQGGTLKNNIIFGNTPDNVNSSTATFCDIQGGYLGTGNINADPLFVAGTLGNYYLSQLGSGQNQQSPCVDAGDPGLVIAPDGTTRTDSYPDEGITDMGYHFRFTTFRLQLKAFLEGPFNGSVMSTTLNPVLPLSHPFNPALPYYGNPLPDWYFAGPGAVGAIPNPNIVDWVLVELRDAPTAATALKATMVAQMPGFILNNGNIVSLDGASNLQFSNVIANNLWVVIYHRNHESIMNANTIPYASGTFTYDYTTGVGQTYGGLAGHKEIVPGVWGMHSGDGDGNCDVLNADRDNVWDIQAGKTGYLPSDYNMNRQTNNVDKNDKWRPNLGTGSQVPN